MTLFLEMTVSLKSKASLFFPANHFLIILRCSKNGRAGYVKARDEGSFTLDCVCSCFQVEIIQVAHQLELSTQRRTTSEKRANAGHLTVPNVELIFWISFPLLTVFHPSLPSNNQSNATPQRRIFSPASLSPLELVAHANQLQ